MRTDTPIPVRGPTVRYAPVWVACMTAAAFGWTYAPIAGADGLVENVLASDSLTLRAGLDTAYDSNLFRIPDSVDPEPFIGESRRSDWLRTGSAGVTLDLPVSLQRFRLEGDVARSEYQRFDFLSHTSWSGLARWDWAYGSRWSGRVGMSSRRELESFTEFRDPVLDLVDAQQRNASVLWHPSLRFGLGASYRQRQREHGAGVREVADLDSRTYGARTYYRGRGGSEVGVRASYEDGEFPNRTFQEGDLIDDGYRQYRAVLAGSRQTGRSGIDAEIGYAWRRNDHLRFRDFSGIVGELTFTWMWSADSVVQLGAARRVGALRDLFSSSVITNAADLGWAWQAGHRTTVNLYGGYEHREFQDDGLLTAPDGDLPEEYVWTAGTRLDYQLRRSLTLSLGFEHGWRESSRADFDYDYNAITLSVRGAI